MKGMAIALMGSMLAMVLATPAIADRDDSKHFNRIASFPVFLNNEPADIDEETVAEIVAAANDGNLLVYTDAAFGDIGFVDISDPEKPEPAGKVVIGGEPTSVAVKDDYALVATDTSASKTDPSGELVVVEISSQSEVRRIDLGGQPDAVDISPDGQYAAVVIENERDEDLCVGGSDDGLEIVDDDDYDPPNNTTEDLCEDNGGIPGDMPQTRFGNPPGELLVVSLSGEVEDWAIVHRVALTGLADLYPTDPEPEYVDINEYNVAVVSLQENNHIVLVDIGAGVVIQDFSAGTADLKRIDTEENSLIELKDTLKDVLREPDGVTWLGNQETFATADEGDLNGGSRGFTFYNTNGAVINQARSEVEELVVRLGHYPEERSENKGNEPENVAYGKFGDEEYLFVGSERSSVIVVYELGRGLGARPRYKQTLPAGVGPEGIIAIPERDLLVAASEEDAREDKIRSALNIYQLQRGPADYPTLKSADRRGGLPIPWGAQSALATDPDRPRRLYSVYDSFYEKSRIFTIELSENPVQGPATITDELVMRDSHGLLAGSESAPFVEVDELCVPLTGVPKRISLSGLVNADGTVNLDPEGLDVADGGGFYVASEGSGNLVCQKDGGLRVSGASEVDGRRPFESPNLIVKVDEDGSIVEVIQLPEDVAREQARFGFEGVTARMENGSEVLYVAFQRDWDGPRNNNGDPAGVAGEQLARIGRYDTQSKEWTFLYYDLAEPTSPAGGWVGLSEIVDTGNDNEFAVIERDNQGGPDATIKTLVTFTANPADFKPNDVLSTTDRVSNQSLANDLLEELAEPGGLVLEKVEGLTTLPNGRAAIITDNDGVDDASGETQLQIVPLVDPDDTTPPDDQDGDGVPDTVDNCLTIPNPQQRDTDGDGFGNRCDPDFNNNGVVDPFDLSRFKSVFGSTSSPDEDLNGNGVVDPFDLSILKEFFGRPPGPSCCAVP